MSGDRTSHRLIGRYAIYREIAAGGMATVHLGRLVGPVGFSRTVAIKKLHPQFAKDEEFVSMFLDEARVAARVQHPNVVSTLDVVAVDDEVFLVMDYVHGESLARLMRRYTTDPIPPRIAASVLSGVLLGLHAAHEAVTEQGQSLNIVHRDVSPQNILVGADGIARVLDFGVAKAVGRAQTTQEGQLKGKLAYMAPEQLRGEVVDRRADLYGASVVLWEALTGRRLFDGDNPAAVLTLVVEGKVDPPSHVIKTLPPELDAIVLRGLARSRDDRFVTARDMAIALEDAVGLASPRQVGEWVEALAGEMLSKRSDQVKEVESISSTPTGSARDGSPLSRRSAVSTQELAQPPPTSVSSPVASGPLVSAHRSELVPPSAKTLPAAQLPNPHAASALRPDLNPASARGMRTTNPQLTSTPLPASAPAPRSDLNPASARGMRTTNPQLTSTPSPASGPAPGSDLNPALNRSIRTTNPQFTSTPVHGPSGPFEPAPRSDLNPASARPMRTTNPQLASAPSHPAPGDRARDVASPSVRTMPISPSQLAPIPIPTVPVAAPNAAPTPPPGPTSVTRTAPSMTRPTVLGLGTPPPPIALPPDDVQTLVLPPEQAGPDLQKLVLPRDSENREIQTLELPSGNDGRDGQTVELVAENSASNAPFEPPTIPRGPKPEGWSKSSSPGMATLQSGHQGSLEPPVKEPGSVTMRGGFTANLQRDSRPDQATLTLPPELQAPITSPLAQHGAVAETSSDLSDVTAEERRRARNKVLTMGAGAVLVVVLMVVLLTSLLTSSSNDSESPISVATSPTATQLAGPSPIATTDPTVTVQAQQPSAQPTTSASVEPTVEATSEPAHALPGIKQTSGPCAGKTGFLLRKCKIEQQRKNSEIYQ